MPRTDAHIHRPHRGPANRTCGPIGLRLGLSVCLSVALGMAIAALPIATSPMGPTVAVPQAQAQVITEDRATQALFLAVDRNDLPGVQAAIDGGADIEAKDFNGMQAVDLAIERGYFDIAHYLISVRNQIAARGGPVTPAPSPAEIEARQQQAEQPPARAPQAPLESTPERTPERAPEVAQGGSTPFDAPRASDGLPVIGEVQEPVGTPAQTAPAPAPVPPTGPVTPETQMAETTLDDGKTSATKRFVTTFFDFFKPPNTTGIVRKAGTGNGDDEAALTDEELNKQLQELDAELGTSPIKGPAVPITAEELASQLPPAPELPEDLSSADVTPLETSELPPYQVMPPRADLPQRPEVPSDEAFGDLTVEEVTAEDTAPAPAPATAAPDGTPQDVAALDTFLNEDLPFNGGVDPDILALLGMEVPAGQAAAAQQAATSEEPVDPFASISEPADTTDPFAQPEQDTDESVAGILETIDSPREVTELQARKPPAPGGADGAAEQAPFATAPAEKDPFATAPDDKDPFATHRDGDDVDELAGLLESTGEKVTGQDGWDVKEVEGAALPSEMPLLASLEPTGTVLDGVDLTLGVDITIGQPVGEERLKMLSEETIHKPCIQKGGPETVFCIDKVNWPFALEEDFLVDTIMYQGTRAITRYDAGRSTYYHTLFKTEAFPKVVKFYTETFGPPSEKVDRAIAPLAQPRRDNPTYIWRSREAGTDTITTLEVRQFDDARGGGFPDTKRGVVLLYREHAGTIFPLLSQLELMVLKESGAVDLSPKTPDSVW